MRPYCARLVALLLVPCLALSSVEGAPVHLVSLNGAKPTAVAFQSEALMPSATAFRQVLLCVAIGALLSSSLPSFDLPVVTQAMGDFPAIPGMAMIQFQGWDLDLLATTLIAIWVALP